jgi:hypothetical protein
MTKITSVFVQRMIVTIALCLIGALFGARKAYASICDYVPGIGDYLGCTYLSNCGRFYTCYVDLCSGAGGCGENNGVECDYDLGGCGQIACTGPCG